jgi:hypothetical protein
MKPLKKIQLILISYSATMALSALLALGMMLSSPSEPGNTFLFGLSLMRLIPALGLLAALVIFILLAVKTARDDAWTEKKLETWFGRGRASGVLALLGVISFGLGWIGTFLPSYRVGRFENYWLRIQPVMLFLLLAGVATLGILYIQNKRGNFINESNSRVIRLGVVSFAICMVALTAMVSSGFGIHSRDDFWYGAGVPILFPQLIGAILAGTLFLQVERKWNFRQFDFVVFILLFAVTAFFWAREPLQKGFSFVSYPPNNVLYPIFDPAVFDTASQFPLIGERIQIFGGYFFERPLYLVLLVYLHSFFGQNYEVLMAWQAGLFAIFPALIYLIGRSLNFRVVGFAAAIAAMLRGVNSIAASNMIDLANPKMILTDFPAAIGVALIVLAVCEWVKQPRRKWHYALWVGGALGFTLMLRTNALMLLALIPIYVLLKFYKNLKAWVLHISLLLLAIIAITLPWEFRNRSLGGQMYGPIISKFRAVIETRYTSPSDTDTAPQLPTTQSLFVLSTLYQEGKPAQSEAVCETVPCFVSNHFLHNIFTSVLILPTSPIMDGLRQTVRDNHPYWYPRWDGKFAPSSLFFFVVNIFIGVLGISIAWSRARLPGMTPLVIFLFYNLSNAFARTSGGRYVVPMDWIVTVYFLLGVLQLVIWVARALGVQWEPSEKDSISIQPAPNELPRAAFALVVILVFGSLLPLSEHLYSPKFRELDIQQVLDENQMILETAGLNTASIDSFLQNEKATILTGRALFPRHYGIDEGLTYFYPNLPLPFPRLTFNLIGPKGQQGIVLPGDVPDYFPHASDVLVIGCLEPDRLDALAVIVQGDTQTVYTRSPESELTCPLRQPVCDNNSVCK